jgi:hypothetical protein
VRRFSRADRWQGTMEGRLKCVWMTMWASLNTSEEEWASLSRPDEQWHCLEAVLSPDKNIVERTMDLSVLV